MMKLAFFLSFLAIQSMLFGQTPLFVPDTLSGASISLTIHRDSVQFFPSGGKSYTYAYNQYAYLGPTLIFKNGEQKNISVHNQLDDTTTLHWHGIHIPSKWDGGPHSLILPGDTWNPLFTVMDKAGTYWYHPHTHMKTAEQAIKGAVGLIIVRDLNEGSLSLPRTYGVDDFPLVVQSQQYDSANQAMPRGMEDSTILVNGGLANNGYSVYGEFPAQWVRLRLLNGSGERSFNFGFNNNVHFLQIASDGGLLNTPFDTTRVRLSPGERAEIMINLTGLNGQSLQLMSYGSELNMGIQGGPTMPMPPGSPPMDSPLNGQDFSVMDIHVTAQTANPVLTVPTVLENNIPLTLNDVDTTRIIRFTADSLMVMDGPFYFNDSSFNMDRIDFVIPVGTTEAWRLVNETMVAHPFHIHDVQFNLVDRSGLTPGAAEFGRKDVVLVPPGDSVVFVARFEDFTDTIIPFMYHCHILMHEDDGMMGQFLVVPADYLSLKENYKMLKELTLYPNPSVNYIRIKDFGDEENKDIRIVDKLGKVIWSIDDFKGAEIDVSNLSKGSYTLLLKVRGSYFQSPFIKN